MHLDLEQATVRVHSFDPRVNCHSITDSQRRPHSEALSGHQAPMGSGHGLATPVPSGGEGTLMKKILLVDDSATVRLMERMVLGKQPYQLVEAHDGADGVQAARAERPDLIIMDVVMPNMDGIEALRRIRAEEALRAIPVIMVTTRGEPEHVERGYAAGCNDYVTKPINGPEFLTKVRQALGA
jgi:CheY-like chemotaxis protein